MENQIKNKVVTITGGSSGIGKAIALLLASNGAKVVIGARREDELKAIVKNIKDAGGEAVYKVADVKQRNDMNSLVALAVDTYGRLDVFINNAGISPLSRFDELQVDEWDDMIDINLRGVLYGIAAALPIFKKKLRSYHQYHLNCWNQNCSDAGRVCSHQKCRANHYRSLAAGSRSTFANYQNIAGLCENEFI